LGCAGSHKKEIIEGKPFQGVEYLSPQCPSPYQSSAGMKESQTFSSSLPNIFAWKRVTPKFSQTQQTLQSLKDSSLFNHHLKFAP
jgi:hypothetical protein